MKKLMLLILLFVSLENFGQTTSRDSVYGQRVNIEVAREYLANALATMPNNDDMIKITNMMNELSIIQEKLVAIESTMQEASPNLGGGEMEQSTGTEISNNEAPAEEEVLIESNSEPVTENTDTESMLDKMNPMKKLRSAFVIETGVNGLSGNMNRADIKLNNGGSWFWTYSFMKQIARSKSFDLEIGLAYHKNRFKFSNDVALDELDVNSRFKVVPNAKEDTKLHVCYLAIPLMSSIHLSKKTNLYLGGTVGYRVGAKQFIETQVNQEQILQERKSDYGLNDLMIAVKGGIGFKKFDIIGQYHLSNLFASKNIYDFKAFSIGTMFRI
jgi:hypothetical protein